jgi:membrane dipeptidase
MRKALSITVSPFLAVILLAGCDAGTNSEVDAALFARADSLAHAHIIVDGHIDVPYRLGDFHEDISEETVGGDFDYPRAVEGGLDAPFMSIYIPASYQETGGAAEKADSLIDLVEGFVDQWPDKFAHAYSVDDVRENFEAGLISLPMGLENGAPIGEDLSLLHHFYDRGIRYITLAHSLANKISDSSYDSLDVHQGLSPFGEEVVHEMNRIGMIVDVSHISDSAFYDVMELTSAPVMATHSSVRHFTPGWERNMNDDMIERLAENEGVIMISFGSTFLQEGYDAEGDSIEARLREQMRAEGLEEGTPEAAQWFEAQRKEHLIGSTEDVIAHINHVVDLVGVDHVGLGSDYDGVFALPEGLEDVSTYPNLVYHLLLEGYSDEDMSKILGENALRVWSEVERLAES